MPVEQQLEDVVRRDSRREGADQRIDVIGDGRVAARAVAAAASAETAATAKPDWVSGAYLEPLEELIINAPRGVTVAAGEPSVPVTGGGSGGRNTHTALAAARMIAGSEIWFAALATDGDDGNSGSAGAIVDGTTISRGGPADEALGAFDSATYLRRTGDLIETGPTGTNVADVWLVWKPEDDLPPILAS
jgi:hydroxypyruvate reductase